MRGRAHVELRPPSRAELARDRRAVHPRNHAVAISALQAVRHHRVPTLLGEPDGPSLVPAPPRAHTAQQLARDCVYAIQRHFVDRLADGAPFESTGDDYLKSTALMEACYQTNAGGAGRHRVANILKSGIEKLKISQLAFSPRSHAPKITS